KSSENSTRLCLIRVVILSPFYSRSTIYYNRKWQMMLKIKSEENMLDNFIKVADMPQEIIEKYKNQVPAEFVQIWQEDGLR
ncbi:hypothetical protein, partial [Mogibacterium diversum]